MPLKMNADELQMVNLTPMIDILFQLIIFFMVSASFTETDKQVDVKVPSSNQTSSLPSATSRNVVHVQRDGQMTLNAKPVTIDGLTAQLKQLRTTTVDMNVIVRGDADGPLQNVAVALAACRAAGVSDVGIAVRPADQGATRR